MYESVDPKLFEELAEKVTALCRPTAYPESTDTVESIETHMAWVFLTDLHAYKLKKPLRTRYFDHTTASARRNTCQKEVNLNRRLAPDVYLGVVPVSKSAGGYRVDGGKSVDWMVKMRRLPRNRMLEHRIEHDDVTASEIDKLAKQLSRFYANAQPAGFDETEYRKRMAADIDDKCETLKQPQYGLAPTEVDRAGDRLHRWLDRHAGLLDQRSSRVVDAHGDLRPEHICLVDDHPIIIDCLEFERDLRLLDPVSELSFLALECDRLGADWIGDRLMAGYSEHSGDEPHDALTAFYKAYHALVRAAVAVWHIDDEVLNEPEKWRQKGTEYIREIEART